MLKGLLISVLLTASWICAQIVIFHLRRPSRLFAAIAGAFAVTVPLFPVVYLLAPADLFFLPPGCARAPCWVGLFTGMVAHLLFFFAYVEFFYYVERSVTLRVLVEIHKRPGRTVEDVRDRYSVKRMVSDRLGAMKENGFVGRRGERWLLTAKGRVFARIFILARQWLNLGSGQ